MERKALVNARIGWYHALAPSVALGIGLFTDRSGERESWAFVPGEGDFYGASIASSSATNICSRRPSA